MAFFSLLIPKAVTTTSSNFCESSLKVIVIELTPLSGTSFVL